MDQKSRRRGEEDGLDPFARMIEKAFQMAKEAEEMPLEKVTDVEPINITPQSTEEIAEDDTLIETEAPPEPILVESVEDEEHPLTDVETTLAEMGILDPVELPNAS